MSLNFRAKTEFKNLQNNLDFRVFKNVWFLPKKFFSILGPFSLKVWL